MVAKKLSTHMKKTYIPLIEERDGKNCFYCDKAFESRLESMIKLNLTDNPKEIDHLNNDEEDNRLDNLVQGHRLCNQRKKQGYREWEIKAKKKLRDNERSANIPKSHADSDKETATETDTNAIFADIVIKELAYFLLPKEDGIPRKTELPRPEFLNYVAGIGFKKVGHASQNSFSRIVDMFCTTEFPYIKEQLDNKKWIIRLRTDDDKDFFDKEK